MRVERDACPMVDGVMCQLRNRCPICGWNPEVSARRAEAFREKLKERGAGNGRPKEKHFLAAAGSQEGKCAAEE